MMKNTAQTQPTDCPACQRLAVVRVQCNSCRANRPNAQTVMHRALVADVESGMTPAEAEAKRGLVGYVVNQ